MAVRRWAWLLVAICAPLMGVPALGAQQPPSGQQAQSPDQELPSAPQPQPTAGQKPQASPQGAPSKPAAQAPGSQEPVADQGGPPPNEPPRSEPPQEPGTSSSRDNPADLSPPPNDAKDHPNSWEVMDDSGITEFHPFDPHRAAKDVEVGDFYFRRHNYRAAVSRYRDALLYKPNDAVATYSLASALEKAGDLQAAAKHYQDYLKILPYGPKAAEAHKALGRLNADIPGAPKPSTAKAAKPEKQ